MNRRMSILLSPDQVALLQHLYWVRRIPSDQYKRRPRQAAQLLREWNALSGRDDTWEEVIHFIITRRKTRRWVTFNGGHVPLSEPNWDMLTQAEWLALQQAYQEVVLDSAVASDNLAYDRAMAAALARRFAALTGRSIPSPMLTSLVMSKRKRGEWLRLNQGADGIGFGDINEVA